MMTLLPSLKAISTAQQTHRQTERETERDWGYRSSGQKRQKKGKEDSTDDTKNDSDLSLSLCSLVALYYRVVQQNSQLNPVKIPGTPFRQRSAMSARKIWPKKAPQVQCSFLVQNFREDEEEHFVADDGDGKEGGGSKKAERKRLDDMTIFLQQRK